MITILFDTDMVANWHQGEPGFRLPLQSLFTELSKHGATITKFISVVTVQELSYWAQAHGDITALDRFIGAEFTILNFDRLIARRAAELQRDVGRPPRAKPKSSDKAQVAHWFRDAAIVATAVHHKLHYIFTADRELNGFFNHITLVIFAWLRRAEQPSTRWSRQPRTSP
ncbi:type II toxin-antitoxin system VapC family toxin [Chondromyces apiculatus]|uniref:type II toxin-antitoxin system VapC family toxin n=1 Tax=Chondromyces apiculatus TaxID=51 RepID=UPI0005C438C8|nr:PIN domain-containing protein [Chondromyces apiculatus]